MTKPSDLIAYLFDRGSHPLSATLSAWITASPRFAAFADTYRDKIRKKIRISQDPETALDLLGELEVAYRLLADRRLEFAYEPYASTGRRSADFAATYRANLVFNIEVARLRWLSAAEVQRQSKPSQPVETSNQSQPSAAVETSSQAQPVEERILRLLIYKLGQMQPAMPNLLVIRLPEDLAQATDLASMMHSVKLRADRKDPAFYAGSPYDSPAAFYKDFLRLSAILLWSGEVQVWENKQSRPGMEGKLLRLVGDLLGAG